MSAFRRTACVCFFEENLFFLVLTELPAALRAVPGWQVQKGELVCVVGRVGSGKSSLVQALLGEMEKSKGTVKVRRLTLGINGIAPVAGRVVGCSGREDVREEQHACTSFGGLQDGH